MRTAFYGPLRNSLRKKIVVVVVAFFCIPFLLFEMGLFRSWLGTTQNIVVHQYETILNDAVESLGENIGAIEKMNDFIYRDYQNDPVFFGKLTEAKGGPELRNDPYLNTVFTQLSNQFFSQVEDELVFSYLTMQGDLIFQRANRPGRVQFVNFLRNYGQEPWFRFIVGNGPVNSVLSAHRSFFSADDSPDYFSFGQVIRSPFNLQPAGVSILSVHSSIFRKLLKNEADNKWIKTVVTDGRQNLMFTNDSTGRPPRDSSHIFRRTMEPYGWEVNAYLSDARLSRSYIVNMIQNNVLFVSVSAILFAMLLAFLNRQLKPLHLLADKMKKAKEGQFHVKIAKLSSDELGMLCDIFNEMTSEIQRLFENQKKEYQEKLHFQMKSLEMQINPHFIYNMLDLIQSRVYEEEPDKAADLIVSLSHIMRYTTTRPGEKVWCAEEYEWMKHYIYLQKQLFARPVDVQIEFEDRIMSSEVHKLMLQPIIENSFVHGFGRKSDGCKLVIKGYEADGQLSFEVRDNGVGFPEPVGLVLTRDNVDVLKNLGNGLYVTAQRFLLLSDDATIRLRSVPGEGTHIVMTQKTESNKAKLYDKDANFVG